ncbi:MAG: amidase, partial [Burkholderiales bacterium]|nr:amidase [Burkholderiales bacterium]
NAVVTLDAERALQRAAAADAARAAGAPLGPLHGLPMTVKDSFETAGLRTTSGAPQLAGHVPAADADAVARLAAAGAIVFGKTNLPTFAMDIQSVNPVFGCANNPWDLARTPGGSSGGAAAALAAGFTALELGSDIGGSIRIPSHFCGVYGHKASHGIVPHRGHIPGPPGSLQEVDIAVFGPMARSAEDLALGLGVLSGPSPERSPAWRLELPPPRKSRLADFRVAAWLGDPECPIDAAVRERLEAAVEALRRAGAKVDEAARPAHSFGDAMRVFRALLMSATSTGLPPPVFDELVRQAGSDAATPAGLFARNSTMRHRDWIRVNEERERQRRNWAAFFGDWDVLLCPVTPTPAIPHDHAEPPGVRKLLVDGQEHNYWGQTDWPGLAGAALLPATVAPLGCSAQGLPVGVQIVGPYLEDRTTIEFARLLGQVIGGYQAPPGY